MSNINDQLKMKGSLQVRLNDEVVREVDNLVVTAGKGYVASRMKSDASGGSAIMSHMGIGSGSTSAAAGDTALGSQLGRVALTSTGISGAVQTQILGFSTGKSVRDKNCERIKLSKTLYDMGMRVAAVSLMCQDYRVWSSMMDAGTPCPIEGKIGDEAKVLWDTYPDRIPNKERRM